MKLKRTKKAENETPSENPEDSLKNAEQDTPATIPIEQGARDQVQPKLLVRWVRGLCKSRKAQIIFASIVVLLASGVAVAVVPETRYQVLNIIGNADAQLTVINATSKNPVAGATVKLSNGDTVQTDEKGVAFFNDTDYGTTTVTIEKSTYASASHQVTVNRDNVNLGELEITPIGIPLNVKAVDWLTQKPVSSFSISIEGSDEPAEAVDGIATLNVPLDLETLVLKVTSEQYNEKSFTIKTDDATLNRDPKSESEVTEYPVELVQSGEHYFISNRDGDISFYESAYDGSNIEKLVTTNQKTDYFEYYSIPDTELYVALLTSTGTNNNGRQDQLALIDTEAKTLKIIDEAPGQKLDIDVVASSKDAIVYQVVYQNERADKYKTKSYNFATGKLTTHFSAPGYYWPIYDQEHSALYIYIREKNYPYEEGYVRKLERISLQDNKITRIISDQDILSAYIHSSKPDKLLYYIQNNYNNTVAEGYYLLDLADTSKVEYIGTNYPNFEEPDEIPDSEKGQVSPNKTNRIWIDQRDNRGRLILNDSSNVLKGDVEKLSVNSIIRWVNDTQLTVIASDGQETADYIVDTETGNYRKIVNSLIPDYGGYGY